MSVSKDGVEGEQEGFIGSSSRCPTKYLFFQCSCLQCRSLKKRRKKYGIHLLTSLTIEFSLVTLPCLTLCDPMDCGIPHFPVHHQLPELAQTQVHRVADSIHLILCHPPLLLPSVFPSIRVFLNESVLRIRQPKYWSFNFSISPSNEYSQLISFMADQFDLLAVQGTLKSDAF